jgi:hypothetical protein
MFIFILPIAILSGRMLGQADALATARLTCHNDAALHAADPAHLFQAMQVMPIRSKVVVCTAAKRKIAGAKIGFSALSISASIVGIFPLAVTSFFFSCKSTSFVAFPHERFVRLPSFQIVRR